jgi:hypothetical protein
MTLVNMTPHNMNFTDGSELAPSGFIASISWVDTETQRDGLTLVKREPTVSEQQIAEIETALGEDGFGIVSFPVVSAIRGTRLEGRVGSVIMKSRTEKIAFPDKFSI